MFHTAKPADAFVHFCGIHGSTWWPRDAIEPSAVLLKARGIPFMPLDLAEESGWAALPSDIDG
ncbi:MAG: hypothetical protein MI724_14350, partial [Spirochaetales bacterium]|nr:hypothetical protein [Spirochaetales bacterium]